MVPTQNSGPIVGCTRKQLKKWLQISLLLSHGEQSIKVLLVKPLSIENGWLTSKDLSLRLQFFNIFNYGIYWKK
uniref:Uncharacterized protein n=1 Tax=Arundo donax TaxID=35708 RepID=A0A0A9FK09_ARUDO